MSQQDKKEIVVGSLISVSNSIDGGRWLGLVVDQEAGRKWVDRDPCMEYDPPTGTEFLLVRVFGLKLTEGEAIGKKGLPKEEPNGVETVRWAYAQLNQAFVVAGPDLESIENFLDQCVTCHALGMHGAKFFWDLGVLVEYLRGVKREPDAIGYSTKKFLAMLEEVLPQQR